MNNCLRIAFLISKTKELPDWEMAMLRSLIDSNVMAIDAFIITNQKTEIKLRWSLRLFQKFEDWWFRSVPDAYKKFDVTKEFDNIRMIDATACEKIAALNLDIIYCSCMAAYSKELVSYTKYGLWHIEFGGGDYYRAMPVSYWEVMNDIPETASALIVQLRNEVDEVIVYNGTTTTVPYSVKNTLNSIAWKSSSFLLYRITELWKTDPGLFFLRYKKMNPATQNKIIINPYTPPNDIKVLGFFIRNGLRYLQSKWFTLFFSERRFTILHSQQKFEIGSIDLVTFTPLKLPKDIFWADPFIIENNGEVYIFFEEFSYKKNKAHISFIKLKKDGSYTVPVIVLDKAYHLSYPFIFESESFFYMIPESCGNKTVELYKCNEFPLKWAFVENLMENIALIDATLFHHDNKWWLFGTQTDHPFTSTNDQLFLYYSETLFSPNWKPHPQNPVATYISNCRPAGKIFQHKGKLYRPAQNNSSSQYGYAIKINEIEILNETEYREREVFEIVPNKMNKLSAVHTINCTDTMIVIDGIIK